MKPLPNKYIDRLAGLTMLSYAEVADELGVSVFILSTARKGKGSKLLERALQQLGTEQGVWDGKQFTLPICPANERATRLRRFLGLSQAAAAKKYNVSQSHVSYMETGEIPVAKNYLSALEKAARAEGLVLPDKAKK